MAVLVSDSFNRVDSTTTLGNTDSAAGGTAKTWAYIGTAVWGISSNQAYTATTANDSPAVVDMTTDADNARVSVDINVSTGIYLNGLSFRVQNTNNYFRAYGDNGTVKLDRVLSGSATALGSASTGATAPFTLSVELTGSTIKVFANGVLKITVTDTNLQTQTKHGLFINNGAPPRLDNFKVESLASGTAFTASLSDSVTTSETFSKALSKTKSDTVTLSETFAKLLSKTMSDSVSTSEVVGKTVSKTKSDAITLSESFSKSLTVTIVDTVTTSETTGKADSKAFSDAVSSSDSITSTKGKAISLSDSITIVDAISKAVSRLQTDTVALTESKSDANYRGIFDALTTSDAITFSKGKAILFTDAISLTDSIGKSALLNKIETLLMTDALNRSTALHVQLYDIVITTDSLQTLLPNAPTLVGTVELKGSRELYIYLLGSRELHVPLIGSRELTISLRGGLPVSEKGQNISMYAGESKEVIFTATDNITTLPINLTGSTIKWAMRRLRSLTDALSKSTTLGIVVTDATTGIFTVTLSPIDTATLIGDFQHQAEVVDANGKVSIVSEGNVSISKNFF